MTTWLPLTAEQIDPLLTAAQRESLAARPAIGESGDALTLSFIEATARFRLAIRQHETNILAVGKTNLPPELLADAAALAIGALSGRLPGFVTTLEQDGQIDEAIAHLSQVAGGALPVSVPDDPEPMPAVRRTFGPALIRSRERTATGGRLRGL